MSIATKRGDQGQTDLLFGQRASKAHPRVHALGAVDELNAALGLLAVSARRPQSLELVRRVQPQLVALMGELATPPGSEEKYRVRHPLLGADEVAQLDREVTQLEAIGFTFEGWVFPGQAGVLAGAQADWARVVCRRAERCIADLEGSAFSVPNPEILRYLNRLSDVLWLLARLEEKPLSDAQ
jgi:cob(I)alamin adenosyltransferase